MECPRCGQIRYKRSWKNSQWSRYSPYTDEFNCCKECHPSGFYVDTSELLDAWRLMQHCAMFVAETPGLLSHIEAFIVQWMTMPRDTRKWLSYYGGIRRRRPKHPQQKFVQNLLLSLFLDDEGITSLWGKITPVIAEGALCSRRSFVHGVLRRFEPLAPCGDFLHSPQPLAKYDNCSPTRVHPPPVGA